MMNPVGDLFQMYRFKHDLTVRDMALQLGISASTVSRIEQGKAVDGKTLMSLINWLQTRGRRGSER